MAGVSKLGLTLNPRLQKVISDHIIYCMDDFMLSKDFNP
jgi:hypothetical protein